MGFVDGKSHCCIGLSCGEGSDPSKMKGKKAKNISVLITLKNNLIAIYCYYELMCFRMRNLYEKRKREGTIRMLVKMMDEWAYKVSIDSVEL